MISVGGVVCGVCSMKTLLRLFSTNISNSFRGKGDNIISFIVFNLTTKKIQVIAVVFHKLHHVQTVKFMQLRTWGKSLYKGKFFAKVIYLFIFYSSHRNVYIKTTFCKKFYLFRFGNFNTIKIFVMI